MTDDAELCTCGHSRREHSTRSDHAERIPGINLPPWCHLCHAECIYCPPDEDEDDLAEPELTAEEARDLADDLGTQLYRAQDALAFVEECCVIVEREGRTVTVADVRTWLKGAQCGRQLAADGQLVVDPAAPPVHLVTWKTGTGVTSGRDFWTPTIPRFTYRPVTPEMERAATERAVQAAADSERSNAWFAETGGVLGAPAANNAEECPRTTADNSPTSSDTPDNPLREQP